MDGCAPLHYLSYSEREDDDGEASELPTKNDEDGKEEKEWIGEEKNEKREDEDWQLMEKVVKEMVQQIGASVTNMFGETPLHFAVNGNASSSIIRLLISFGANLFAATHPSLGDFLFLISRKFSIVDNC